VLDLGCGAADVTIRFARAHPGCDLIGVDGAPAMLALAQEAVTRAGLADRIQLREVRLPGKTLAQHVFDTVISNSLLHHLADPQVLWRTVVDCAEPGAAVFIMDLRRPDTRAQAGRLAQEYSGNEPEVLRRDFFNSLLSAYRPEEIAAQLARVNLSCLQVEAVGDRHVVVHGHLSS